MFFDREGEELDAVKFDSGPEGTVVVSSLLVRRQQKGEFC